MNKEALTPSIEMLTIEEIKSSNLSVQAERLLNISLSSLKKVKPIGPHGRRRPEREIRDILQQRRTQIVAIQDALAYLEDRGRPSIPIEFLFDQKDKKILGFEIGMDNKGPAT